MSPTVFVVLFRGVGGATQLPTGPLREALTAAGFDGVGTYINSGNAVLSSRLGVSGTRDRIAELAKRKFGFEKDIMLVSLNDWSRLIERNPFPEAVDQPATLHAFVLHSPPASQNVAALKARTTGRERLAVDGATLYFHAPDGFGASKLPPLIDRTLKTVSTARNWRTVMALMEKARAI